MNHREGHCRPLLLVLLGSVAAGGAIQGQAAPPIPAGWPRPDSTVHFVTDGIESAVNQAKAASAGKSVGVHGADTIQQLLNAGLLDKLHIDVAAVLLGSGVRLFDRLAGTPVMLGSPTVLPGVGVTHLRYPVRKA